MKTVYRPANGIEAHMLRDLLAQDGIEAHVMGASLEGAIGELPAAGLVRLEVAEEDYAQARALLVEWEKTSPPPEASPRPVTPRKTHFGEALVGLVVGVAASYFFFRIPTQMQAVDYNRDGVPDEEWVLAPGGATRELRADRNGDGKPDAITRFGDDGAPVTAESDDDFDGTFETRITYRHGQVERSELDADGNGVADVKWSFRHGVLETTTHIDKHTGRPLRIEYYRTGRITHAEVDTDRDGALDRRVTYSQIGEETSVEDIVAAR